MRRIKVEELKDWIDKKKNIQILDTRERDEFELAAIGNSTNIPKAELQNRYEELRFDTDTIVVCRFGTKSAASARFLISKGFDDEKLFLLDGGIYEWAVEIDKNMPSHLL
jgi:rhodanese-related sulfurtransferase